METVVISMLGAGFLGVLGYYLKGIKDDLRTLAERQDRGFAQVDRRLAEHDVLLARIEATLAEHSRLLERLADNPERLAALEAKIG